MKRHPFYSNLFVPKVETWRDVVSYEGIYKVSTWGRVRSLGRWKFNGVGEYYLKGRIMKQTSDNSGRLLVNLTDGNGKCRVRSVHHLVLLAFVGPRPKGMECCHRDGNPLNNRLENLRWDTHSENEKDKIKHGTSHFSGESHYGAKLTETKVREIRNLYGSGDYSLSQLAKLFGVHIMTIHPIVKRRTWKSVV